MRGADRGWGSRVSAQRYGKEHRGVGATSRTVVGVAGIERTIEAREAAWDDVEAVVNCGDRSDVVAKLAAMDMTVYMTAHPSGSMVFWSRREIIASQARCGALSADDFEAFLEAMGETMVWPEDRR